MEDCIDQVGVATSVSKSTCWRAIGKLSARAGEISAFITTTGLYEYTVMSSGLRNAPATFQRLMTLVVAGRAVNLDDVAVFGDTWDAHVQRVRALFSHLAEVQLTVDLATCEFARAPEVWGLILWLIM